MRLRIILNEIVAKLLFHVPSDFPHLHHTYCERTVLLVSEHVFAPLKWDTVTSIICHRIALSNTVKWLIKGA